MTEPDNILQNSLEALEKGLPLQTVQAGLPPEAADLAPLLQLSSELRGLPHPQPQTPALLARQHIETAFSSQASLDEKTRPHLRQAQAARLTTPPWGRLNAVYLFSGAALVITFGFLLLAALGFWLIGTSRAQASAVLEVSGQAMLTSTNSAGKWIPAQTGDRLRAGQRLRTGPDSSVTMRFYDGSQVTLASGSDVVVERLRGGWTNSLQLVLFQQAGFSYHKVVPLRGSRSTYQVITPTGAASVHGTSFSVAVEGSGFSRIAVDTGKVVVQQDTDQVTLDAGQATVASSGEEVLDPAYQFTLVGPLDGDGSDGWSVNGVAFQITPETRITGVLQAGAQVLVEGRILDSVPTADRVLVLSDGQAESTFTGILTSMEGETWVVGGKEILVTSGTQLVGDLREGIPVKVFFSVLSDGTWMALEIISLEEPEENPTPTPTLTDTPVITSTATITPSLTATPTAFTNCTGANPQPKGQTLANLYGVPYEEIMGWFCQGFGFGEIDLAYGMSRQYGIPVEQIFDLRKSGLGWGEIKKLVPAITPWVTPTPTITATLTLTPTTTPTVTLTATPVVTATLAPSATPEPTRTGGNCPGTHIHPTGSRLAAQFGVPYEEIMGWFCRGFGFGEIEKAYSLSLQTAIPVESIFAMRSSGLGWGQIEAQLGAKPNAPPDKPVKTKKPK